MGKLKQIRSFNRFELKYLLHREEAEKFKADVARQLEPDNYGDGKGTYVVSSLYFDSLDYRFYWEKVEGIKFRRKLRIRHYETKKALEHDTPVWAEIKQRYNRVTQKRRIRLPYKEALELCTGKIDSSEKMGDHRVSQEISCMSQSYMLKPASVISYIRQAYNGHDYDTGLRVTFDSQLKYNVTDKIPGSKCSGKDLLHPHQIIMEIKVNNRVPFWLTEMVAQHNFRLIRISKYCTSLDRAMLIPGQTRGTH